MRNLIFGYKILTKRDSLRVQDRLLDFDIDVSIKTNDKNTWLFINHDAHQNNEFIKNNLYNETLISKFHDVYFIQIHDIIKNVLSLYILDIVIIGEFRVQNRKFSLPLKMKYDSCIIINKLKNNNFTFIKNIFFQSKKQEYSLKEVYRSLLTFEKDE